MRDCSKNMSFITLNHSKFLNLETTKKEDLSKALSSVANRLLHSYPEQYKRLLICLPKNEYVENDDKKEGVISNGKIYNLIDLVSHLITNHRRLESLDTHFYKF